LIFGASTSVSNYDITGKTILDLALANCEIPRDLVKRTIDDVPVVSPRNKDWGEKFTDEYKKVCKDINIELAEDCPEFEKAFTDSTYGKVLGKFFDTEKMAWMVPEEKRRELIREIESAHKYGVSTKQLESLLARQKSMESDLRTTYGSADYGDSLHSRCGWSATRLPIQGRHRSGKCRLLWKRFDNFRKKAMVAKEIHNGENRRGREKIRKQDDNTGGSRPTASTPFYP
jgi:hypothetical protein